MDLVVLLGPVQTDVDLSYSHLFQMARDPSASSLALSVVISSFKYNSCSVGFNFMHFDGSVVTGEALHFDQRRELTYVHFS